MAVSTFEEYLTEHFVNLLLPAEKEKYKDEVFGILTSSYAPIGGLKGNGFHNADDMIKNIPMWKLVRKNSKIVAVAMYKDKNGRKRVAVGSDGTPAGKDGVASIFREDFQRAYFEISGRSLAFHVKILGYEFIEKYAIDPSKVQGISGDAATYPVPDSDADVKSHPRLKPFFYQREVGGHSHTKIMLGTPGKKIVVDISE